jgi:rubrerythrin
MAEDKKRPVSDLEFNLVTILHNKAEATRAYDTYMQDAQSCGAQDCVELFKKLQQQEIEQAKEVRSHLQKVLEKA